jgi:Na+-transporting NADH:ubiquinone oxidoreductase subunit C
VRKGGAKDPVHEVDAISGATITGDGVSEMLARGLKAYEPYLETLKG